jgi:hypothetical protein
MRTPARRSIIDRPLASLLPLMPQQEDSDSCQRGGVVDLWGEALCASGGKQLVDWHHEGDASHSPLGLQPAGATSIDARVVVWLLSDHSSEQVFGR